jgi:hypothetical protein
MNDDCERSAFDKDEEIKHFTKEELVDDYSVFSSC